MSELARENKVLLGELAAAHKVLDDAGRADPPSMRLCERVERLVKANAAAGHLTRQRDAAMAACRAIATDEATDPCRYDHHVLCQAHGLQPKGECYMELARAAIKLTKEAPHD